MKEVLRIIFLIAPLITGAIAIFFSFQLMRRYKEAFVGSYFYYLVFLYIFGAYSLIGSGFLEHLFVQMEANMDTIHSVKMFAILLGIPLLLLSKYMLIRSTLDLLQQKLATVITAIYFVFSVAAIVVFGVFVVRLTRFDLGEYQAIVSVQRWSFAGLLVLVYTAVFLISLLYSRKMVEHQKAFVRQFGLLYMVFMIITTATYLLSGLYEIILFAFIFFYLSWHLIPLLFLNLYLGKYHGKTATVHQDFESLLSAFSEEFDISKRESEVVKLICSGLSNQEISDSLFISLQTVKDHTHRIFVKTGVKNRVQLANLIRSK